MVTTVTNDVKWELDDRYAHVQARPINCDGHYTNWDMTFKYTKDGWTHPRPVSSNWTPVATPRIVDGIMDRMGNEVLKTTVRRAPDSSGSTFHRIAFMLDHPIELPFKARDLDTRFTNFGMGDNNIVHPEISFSQGYNGCASLRADVSFRIKICQNGIMIPLGKGFGISERALHTPNATERFLNKIGDLDVHRAICEFEQRAKVLSRLKLPVDQMIDLMKNLPKKYLLMYEDEYHDHTAWGAINFLSWVQTHEVSVERANNFQPIVNSIVKAAA